MKPTKPAKPTIQTLSLAVHTMAEIIPFFPRDARTQLQLAHLIGNFVNSPSELRWLTGHACLTFRDWAKDGGLAALRGLYCSRFSPADGISAECKFLGYRAQDLEDKFFSAERAERERRFEEFHAHALSAGQKPFELPAAMNRLASPKPDGEKPPEAA